MAELSDWGDVWQSSDGLSYAEGKVLPPNPPYPAMVSIDAIDLASLSEEDARSLGAWIRWLADVAHHWNRKEQETGWLG